VNCQKEIRIDLVGTRGLMDTLIAERTDQGFAIYDDRGRERLPFLTLARRADKMSSIIKPILGANGEVAADERTRSLILTTSREMLQMIERLIVDLDVETVESDESHRL
jgi:hypothetical protein